MASTAARARSRPASSRSTSFGVGRSPRAAMRSARSRLRPSRSVSEPREVGIVRVGLGDEVEEVERPAGAAARSAVMADTMLPAAPVTTNTLSAVSARSGVVARRALERGRRTSAARRRDRSRPRRGRAASRRAARRRSPRSSAGREVDCLHERVGALAGVGLGEAGDGTAHDRGRRPPRRSRGGRRGGWRRRGTCRARDQRERAHRGREQLDAPASPSRQAAGIERVQRTLVVQGGQPVDAVTGPADVHSAIGRSSSSPPGASSIGRTSDAELPAGVRPAQLRRRRRRPSRSRGCPCRASRPSARMRPEQAGARAPERAAGSRGLRRRAAVRAPLPAAGSARRRCGGVRSRTKPTTWFEGGVVAELEFVVAFDAVFLADGGEELGLLDGVDAEVGFEVEVHVEQVWRGSRSARRRSRARGSATSSDGRGRRGRFGRRGSGAGLVGGGVGVRSRTKATTCSRVG